MRRTKIVAAMLSLVFVFMLFPSLRVNAAASGTCGDNLTWTLDDSTKTLTITGSGEMADYSYDGNTAPWYNQRNDITTVVIGDGVASIGNKAFADCTSLTSITIPNSVTSIGELAFSACYSLTSITIPDSVTTIGKWAFFKCTNLTSITIPDSVTSIGTRAFQGCESLASITIPDSVTSIGFFAFDGCTSLTTVTMNSSLAEKCKDYDVFADCPSSLKINYSDINFTYNSGGNGTVTGYVPGSDPTTVYLTLTPDTGYVVNTVTVTDSTGATPIDPDANGNYSFTMPSEDVTVEATFKRVKADVTFYSDDGTTVLQTTNYDLNEIPAFNGTPTKTGDAQYSYAFKGWNDGSKTYGPTEALPAVTDDASYTAVFESSINEYTVTFTDADGNQLQSGKLPYGTVPAYNGTPAKAETDKYTYTFAGWKSGNSTYGVSSTLPQVSADVTYTAVFTETAKSTPTPTAEPTVATTPATTPAVTTPAPGTYYVQSIEEKDGAIVITIKRTENDDQTYELVQSIETDGKQLNVGDQIELTSGSAIITIKKDFVSTLTPGTHSMKVTFKDGGSITLEYTVKEPEKAAAQAVQATGEAVSAASIAGACLILAAAGITLTVASKRKEEKE